jgi:hypothetical protein
MTLEELIARKGGDDRRLGIKGSAKQSTAACRAPLPSVSNDRPDQGEENAANSTRPAALRDAHGRYLPADNDGARFAAAVRPPRRDGGRPDCNPVTRHPTALPGNALGHVVN